MKNRAEKICFLSEMIYYIKSDIHPDSDEYKVLQNVSCKLNIPSSDFKYLLNHPINYFHLKPYCERYVQFYKLISIISSVNKNNACLEMSSEIYNIGLKMGLDCYTVDRIIQLSKDFNHKNAPVKLLHNMCKINYN